MSTASSAAARVGPAELITYPDNSDIGKAG
jgi:hypothetical protein